MPHDPSLDQNRALGPPAEDSTLGPAQDLAESTQDLTGAYHRAPTTTPEVSVFVASCPIIPGYAITAELAKGGMGRVFAATDLKLEREVAIKTLLPGANASRFVEESKITAKLPHPGIPAVHDLGTLEDGSPFLAMKLVRGKTLEELLRARANPAANLSKFTQIFEHIAQAVGFAHSQGIIHRDLKPANVMVGAFGEVQVMDWGLAKVLSAEDTTGNATATDGVFNPSSERMAPSSPLTRAGVIMGTPGYMAPEQARGECVTEEADVFALGGILAMILTGEAAFVGKTARELIDMSAAADLHGVRSRLQLCGADEELIALALQCLSADPANRPKSAEHVAKSAAAYHTSVEERLQRAKEEEAAARTREIEQRKRRKVQFALSGVVVLVLTLAGGFAYIANERNVEVRLKQKQATQNIASNLELAAALREQAKFAEAGFALDQAAVLSSKSSPDSQSQIKQARRDLDFVSTLDEIRFRKWEFVAGSGDSGEFSTINAPTEYRAAFSDFGLNVPESSVPELAGQISSMSVRREIVAALDDWALFETNAQNRDHLLAVSRTVDPDPWADQLRDAAVWSAPQVIQQLAAEADPSSISSTSLSMLAELMRINKLDPTPMLSMARAEHPSDFELAFVLGLGLAEKSGRDIAPYEAARAIRPDNLTVWNNLGVAIRRQGDFANAIAAFRHVLEVDPNRATTSNNLGLALLDAGDVDEAIVAFNNSIRANPADPAPCNNLGLAYKKKGDLAKAAELFRTAIECDPRHANAHTNLGTVLRRQGDVDGAIVAYKAAIEAAPRDALPHFNLGNLLSEMRETQQAMSAYRKSLQLDPNSAATHNNLGSLYSSKGDEAAAISAFREAIRCDPAHVNSHLNLANSLLKVGETDEAIDVCKTVIELEPTNIDAMIAWGISLAAKGDTKGAIQQYQTAIQINPNVAMIHYNLGNALRSMRDTDGAIASYRQAIELDPGYVKALSNLGNLLQEKGDYTAAVMRYRSALKHDPTHANSHTSLGNALRATGDLPGSIAAHREALVHDSKHALAWYNLGISLRASGDLDGAIAAYRQSIENDPSNGDVYMNLGVALERKGNIEEAIEIYREGITRDPEHMDVRYNLGVAYLKSGDPDAAESMFRKVVAADPKSFRARHNLGISLKLRGDLGGAIAEYRLVLELSPEYVPGYNSLGVALKAQGDLDGAIEAYRRAVEIDPDYARGYRNLGNALKANGDLEGATEAYEKADEVDKEVE